MEWLNGKKTIIGGVILFIGTVLDQVVVGIWGVSLDWIPPTIQTCDWVGMVITAGGLVHKGVKVRNGNGV